MQLNDNNFSLFAAKYYNNPNCTDILEFHDDLNRIKYIKRLLKGYSESGELKERLILNHLITLYNVFEPPACTKMLVFKLPDYLPVLKSFLLHLEVWQDRISELGYDNEVINSNDIQTDEFADSVLANL
jgi:hypothetical protein|tara:strand:- start:274 stop:660 length:387 start_codon:yes stop_codon:yes gene_type:complete